ncbi:hypothetical protein PVAP13_2KG411661 [Panicum virgatum]|uniref:Uncharacterized protein n=1 Tax=Panicum virgatum TaxID=38727 RepID=A0A8T0WAV9_PANVG|nr:hypothetical protein PVAP13_2KG411661 [Panicum virgatum]
MNAQGGAFAGSGGRDGGTPASGADGATGAQEGCGRAEPQPNSSSLLLAVPSMGNSSGRMAPSAATCCLYRKLVPIPVSCDVAESWCCSALAGSCSNAYASSPEPEAAAFSLSACAGAAAHGRTPSGCLAPPRPAVRRGGGVGLRPRRAAASPRLHRGRRRPRQIQAVHWRFLRGTLATVHAAARGAEAARRARPAAAARRAGAARGAGPAAAGRDGRRDGRPPTGRRVGAGRGWAGAWGAARAQEIGGWIGASYS